MPWGGGGYSDGYSLTLCPAYLAWNLQDSDGNLLHAFIGFLLFSSKISPPLPPPSLLVSLLPSLSLMHTRTIK